MSRIPSVDCARRPRPVRLFGALLLMLASMPVYAATQILVFGDSLSAAYGMSQDEGWVALLRERLAVGDDDFEVVNASVSGETTAGGLSRLPAALDKYAPDIVILELGGNDGLRALPLAEMRANLAAMIAASRQAGARVLLLGVRIPSNYGKAYGDRFHGVFEQLAERTGVAYVPFLLAPIAEDRGAFQADGIHPNADAQPRLLDHIWPQLSPLLTGARTIPAAP